MNTLLLGDLSPTAVTNPLFVSGDINALFSDAASLFDSCDVSIVNLECALTNSSQPIQKLGPALKAAPETAGVLARLGVDYCGLSNNHIFDYGAEGVADTMRALDEVGIQYTGFGKNYEDSRRDLVIQHGGDSLCLIAVCEHEYSYATDTAMGSRPIDPFDTIEDIREAKRRGGRVVVYYHGGKEQCSYPSPRLHKLCRAMADAGADVVLCQHSHCIGCYENYHDCHILYGQGNFHFVKPNFATSETWNQSLAVQYDTQTHAISFIPVVNTDTGIALAAGQEKDLILNAFEQRNAELASGAWLDGWRIFCQENKKAYMDWMCQAFANMENGLPAEVFGHYLDCEAHTDVLRELCSTWHVKNNV